VTSLEYHYFPNSHWSRAVTMAIADKALRPQRHLVDISRNATFEPDYMRLNPKGVVPTLVVDGTAVCDSLVIARHLDRLAEPALLSHRPDATEVADLCEALEAFPLMLLSYSVWVQGQKGERSKDILADKVQRAARYAGEYPELALRYERKRAFFERFSAALRDAEHLEAEKARCATFLDELARRVDTASWLCGTFSFADCIAASILWRLADLPLLADWHPDHGGSVDHPLFRYDQRLRARPSHRFTYFDDPLIEAWKSARA